MIEALPQYECDFSIVAFFQENKRLADIVARASIKDNEDQDLGWDDDDDDFDGIEIFKVLMKQIFLSCMKKLLNPPSKLLYSFSFICIVACRDILVCLQSVYMLITSPITHNEVT